MPTKEICAPWCYSTLKMVSKDRDAGKGTQPLGQLSHSTSVVHAAHISNNSQNSISRR